ncbi:replication initiator [Nocardia tengchongensis]|uniref:replication initiator n=1 Tax=Nocardia tengchongensis TaxID=2055889 RepID=UPI0034070068
MTAVTKPAAAEGVTKPAAAERVEDFFASQDFLEMAASAADKFGSCRKPIAMWMVNHATGERKAIGAACGNTLESVCPACSKRKRAIRIRQCREGWHLDEEPEIEERPVTEHQQDLVMARSSLFVDYQRAKEDGDSDLMAGIREIVEDLDKELRENGARRLPPLDAPVKRRRSTRRRQDAPNLPRKKVERRTIGQTFADGKYRPGMFLTLTMDSYGKVHNDGAVNKKGEPCGDGSPRNPDSYDYTRAARDIIHFSALFNRWTQNLRRALGWNVQYFGTVEPQRRGAPHVHLLLRGAIPNKLLRQVTEATYVQAWWPHHDQEVYTGANMPVWDYQARTFVDPKTGVPLHAWEDAQDIMDSCDDVEPAHVIRFGSQIEPRGIVKGTKKADAAIGYLAKYLTKSVAEILEPPNQRTAEHYDRLHAELLRTPCSDHCPVWLRYGIVPKGVNSKTQPGRCRNKAHSRDSLGVAGNRQFVSKLWTGKTLKDHAAERRDFVKQFLEGAGMTPDEADGWDPDQVTVTVAEPGDPLRPPQAHLIMTLLTQVQRRRAQYLQAQMAAGPPGAQGLSSDSEAA